LNRREFLTSLCSVPLGALALGAPAALAADAPATSSWPALKAGENGRLLESSDGGRTWQINADFGPEMTIVSITHDEQYAHLRLAFSGHEFTLISTDGKQWRTAP
jgi:photosystem II stability/assembly factor-like uncharacterized protein